ncbi:hypothetical protein EV174_002601 [Coemansia sp. RSA 2320]|nr:hypothetical protein EV174_002601 [Coemansia sp. RSA 2320]
MEWSMNAVRHTLYHSPPRVDTAATSSLSTALECFGDMYQDRRHSQHDALPTTSTPPPEHVADMPSSPQLHKQVNPSSPDVSCQQGSLPMDPPSDDLVSLATDAQTPIRGGGDSGTKQELSTPLSAQSSASALADALAAGSIEHDDDTQLYLSNPRRSVRKRTQRVLLNVPAPEVADLPPITRSRSAGIGRAASVGSSRASSRDFRTLTASASSSQHSRKRRHINKPGGSSSSSPAASIDSELDFEVSIYTRGTAVPHHAAKRREPTQTCFICSEVLDGDTDAVNAHIDGCLSQSAAGADASREQMMVEYEWDGQRRIRATAMLEGGVVAAGLGYGSSGTHKDTDDDIDVDAEDETNFGAAQYDDSNLLYCAADSEAGGESHRHRQSNLQYEEFAPPLDSDPSTSTGPPNGELTKESSQHQPAAGWQAASGGSSRLVIEALKERIREQDRLLQSAHKCLICLELYNKPCTSINCWHVYCEQCWLHTLGTKKLCPQCQQITQPTDLRRIYL